MNINILSSVLARANACPPSHCNAEFYEVKDLILRTWGVRRRCVVQRIVDRCWGYEDSGCDEYCEKCGGTGVYRTRWFKLEEWELSGKIFHRPVTGLRRYRGPVQVEGKVKHRRSANASICANALFLLFRPDVLNATIDADQVNSLSRVDLTRKYVRVANAIGPVPKRVAMTLAPKDRENEVPF